MIGINKFTVLDRELLKIADFGSIMARFRPEWSTNMAKPKDVVKQIRKATRRKFSAEEKIRIVLEGLMGEIPTSEIYRR